MLADQGIYIASESSFYRALKAKNQLNHRQQSKPTRPIKKPRAFTATAPNQLYSWNITYLPTCVRGIILYLYLVMDVYSRKVVGWQVYENDNAYSESLFRTLKYRPKYPEHPFTNLQAARGWVQGFVDWYNHEHLHSAINFVTPQQRHSAEDSAILAQRQQVYLKVRSNNPSRWSGSIRNFEPITVVYLNPDKQQGDMKDNEAA